MAAGSTDQVLGDAQKQLNQNRRPSCRPGSSPRTRMAVASTMRVFRACPVPDVGSLGGLPRIEFSQSPEGPDSLAAGKNAGNFFDSAVFLRKSVSKTAANSVVCG